MSLIILVDCGSTRCPALSQQLGQLGQTRTIPSSQANGFDFSTCRAAVISGGPRLFTESPQQYRAMMDEFHFISQLPCPTLGICLGHQAIALSLGCTVYRGAARRTCDTVQLRNPQHPLLAGLPQAPVFIEDHCEGIAESPLIEVLASSRHYPVEAFAARSRPFFGVQFHPESSGKNGQQLISNFLRMSY